MGLITYLPNRVDGTICPCLDPCSLNKAIICEHYKAPTLEEISYKLSGTTVFSKLDAKDGFGVYIWTHPHLTSPHLTPSRDLCMPFGLKMSQDVFQMCMDQITNRVPGIIAIHDDMCVFGKTREEHDTHLLQLMKTTSIKWVSI